MSFDSFGLHPNLLKGVHDLGYETATPIQKDAIPAGLAGRDVLACAMTGSGKTAAFVLPILQRLQSSRKGVVKALILSPTRELAAQIEESVRVLGAHTSLRSGAVFGGVAMGPQQRSFQTGVDILVATPGRLLDHFQYPYAKLPGLEILVLDEADRMLDMGFLPDIRRVLQHLPTGERQTMLFSATMPQPIVELSRSLLRNPVMVNIERKAAPATGVTQAVYPVPESLKPALLVALLQKSEIKSALVFTRTKHRANRLADYLGKHGVSCDRIHGNRSQAQRTIALANFKEGRIRVLVATDIAARGIDVEALSHVINLDVPNLPEDYIHRVGRTARAQALGDAFTFVSDGEMGELAAIERAISKRLPRLTLPDFDYTKKPSEKLEIPIAERIAQIRALKAEERARARAKAERKLQGTSSPATSYGRGETRGPAAGERSPRPSSSFSHAPSHAPAQAPGRAPHPRPSQSPSHSPSHDRRTTTAAPAGARPQVAQDTPANRHRRRRPRRPGAF